MFTGLVEQRGEVVRCVRQASGVKLFIRVDYPSLQLGESIAVDGACLTVVDSSEQVMAVELSQETLSLTVAADYRDGHFVNTERSLKIGDRLGGHFVSGHVDQTLRLDRRVEHEQYAQLYFMGVLPECRSLLHKKGSITINGVSLTINGLTEDGFHVMIIPHTLRCTNLSTLQIGCRVNVEYDMLAKMIARQVNPNYSADSASAEDLNNHNARQYDD